MRVPATSLLKTNRFDIAAKFLYASDKRKYRTLYEDHIRAFNGGVETHVYVNQPQKKTVEDFVGAFECLLDSLASSGWAEDECIPVSRDMIPLDGGHRIGIAIALNIPEIDVCKCDWTPANYDYNYFRRRGLHPNHLEHMRACWMQLAGTAIPKARKDPLHQIRFALCTRAMRIRCLAELKILQGAKT